MNEVRKKNEEDEKREHFSFKSHLLTNSIFFISFYFFYK